MTFSEPELQYLKTQRLARIASVSRDGDPDVVPVAFEFDGKHFYVGSHDQVMFHKTSKYLNVMDGNKKVAIVIDDMESTDPWRPRGIKIKGVAEVVDHKGMFGQGEYLRIIPNTSWSWGIKGLKPEARSFRVKTVHNA